MRNENGIKISESLEDKEILLSDIAMPDRAYLQSTSVVERWGNEYDFIFDVKERYELSATNIEKSHRGNYYEGKRE